MRIALLVLFTTLILITSEGAQAQTPTVSPTELARELLKIEEATCRLAATLADQIALGGTAACKHDFAALKVALENCHNACSASSSQHRRLQAVLNLVSIKWVGPALLESDRNNI